MNSISPRPGLSRRHAISALALVGGGAAFGVPFSQAQTPAKKDFGPGGPDEAFKYWLAVGADNTVTVNVHQAEMGQGVATALVQLVAEELGAAWTDMRFAFAPNGRVYYNRGYANKAESTGGSTSIRGQFDMFREIGATARVMFVSAAAAKWKVPATDLSVADGVVRHAKTNRSLRFADLAAAAAKQTPPTEVDLKPLTEWRILGRSVARLDTPAKVDGSAGFGVDVSLPDMAVATIQACPVYGGRLKAVDPAPALKIAGVEKVVKLDNAVAVVASGYWPALKGLKALSPEWDMPSRAHYGVGELNADLDTGLNRADAPELQSKGDVEAGLNAAAARDVFEYGAPYLTHACMEPMNATAHVRKDRIDIWIPNQGHTTLVAGLSKALNVDPATVHVHRTFLGGGFGRRGEADFGTQAALISRDVGRPVKLIWSREEDIRQDFYRPAAKARFKVGLDDKGLIRAWDILTAAPSISKRRFPEMIKDGKDMTHLAAFADQPYNIPDVRVRYALVENGIPVGYWRSVHHSQNTFFRESLINELAARAKKDGLAYRRALFAGNDRWLALLDAAAKLSDFDAPLAPGPAGTRRGRGVAVGASHGSICAQVADVTVARDDSFTVDRFTCVIDVGTIVNPGIVEAQMESSIFDGLAMAAYGGMTPRDGGMAEGNFNEVRFLKLADAPELRVQVKGWPETAPGGVGEPAVPPVAPALTDALARATGVRIRALPIVKQGLGV